MKKNISNFVVLFVLFLASFLVIGYSAQATKNLHVEEIIEVIKQNIPYETPYGTAVHADFSEKSVLITIYVNEQLDNVFNDYENISTTIVPDVFQLVCTEETTRTIIEQGYFGLIFVSSEIKTIVLFQSCETLSDVIVGVAPSNNRAKESSMIPVFLKRT